MGDGESDAIEVKNRGWRQGSVLQGVFADLLVSEELLPGAEHPQEFVIASHDCDVTNRSFDAEPEVELLSAAVLDLSEKDGNCFWGRNPRRYQLERSVPHASIWEFSIQRRVWIPRQRLLESEPDAQLALSCDDIDRLALWLVRRYRRAAFPDRFVERTRAATRKLRGPLKKHGHRLTAVFLLVADDELPEGTPYEVVLYGTMHVDDWSDPDARQFAQALLNKIEVALGESDGVEVKESVLLSEAQISLDDRRRLTRWDFDDLTIRGHDPGQLPPED